MGILTGAKSRDRRQCDLKRKEILLNVPIVFAGARKRRLVVVNQVGIEFVLRFETVSVCTCQFDKKVRKILRQSGGVQIVRYVAVAFEIFKLEQRRLWMKLHSEKRIVLGLKYGHMLHAVLVVVCSEHANVLVQSKFGQVGQRHASMMEVGGDFFGS